MMMTNKALIPAMAALLLLQGCSWFHRSARTTMAGCKENKLELDDRNLPALTAPEGLEAPDTRGAVQIPALDEPERPRAATDPCLSQPPSYQTADASTR
ncbi:MAG: hypothetical protein QM718_03355 [Steroidobacteraceae bacterium]